MSLEARIIALAQSIGADIKALISGKVDKSGAVTSVAGRTGAVTLAKGDVGLGSADNTSDATKLAASLAQMQLYGVGATAAPALADYNVAPYTGIFRGSNGATLNQPAGTNTTILFNGRYSSTGAFQLLGELQASKAGTRLFARSQFGGTFYDYREVAFTDNPAFTGNMSVAGVITGGSSLELGDTTSGTAIPSYIDFHSGAATVDRDARILSTGGTGANDGGDLRISAATITTVGITQTTGELRVAGTAQILAGTLSVVGDMTASRVTGNTSINMNGPAGAQKRLAIYTGLSARWTIGGNATAESGGNVGTDFSIGRFSDAGAGLSTPVVISRATGQTIIESLSVTGNTSLGGPVKLPSYTLTTLPSASANSGALIDVSNAAGGPKTCRSNGTVWQILNTTTTVS